MFEFDLNEVEESSSVIPAGVYRAQVEEVEVKETNSGDGLYIKAQFVVTDEDQNGRKFWHNFNIKNKNEKAVQIGLGQIKSLITSAGGEVGLFNDESALIGLECMVKLKVRASDGYGDQNQVVSFKSLPGELPAEANEKPPF